MIEVKHPLRRVRQYLRGNRGLGRVFVLGFGAFLVSGLSSSSGVSPVPTPSSNGLQFSVQSLQKLGADERARVWRDFQQAQRNQKLALQHQLEFEWNELKTSQKRKKREWESQEKSARHEFFKKNSSGASRRSYVQDFLKRRDEFRAQQKAELENLKIEKESRLNALQTEQKDRAETVRRLLSEGVQPGVELWPKL
jgi:hypothetical protein